MGGAVEVIVTDMINAGPMSTRSLDGKPRSNGLVIGFMGMIGRVLCAKGSLCPALIDAIAEDDDRLNAIYRERMKEEAAQ
jgi:hypothetical protein